MIHRVRCDQPQFQDIEFLTEHFLGVYSARAGKRLTKVAPSVMEQFVRYPWPGNIRELESTVSRAALSAPGRVIRATDIEFLHAATTADSPHPERIPTLREIERAHIVRVLEAAHWNKKEAARLLDISRGTLYRKIVEYALEPAEPRPAQNGTR